MGLATFGVEDRSGSAPKAGGPAAGAFNASVTKTSAANTGNNPGNPNAPGYQTPAKPKAANTGNNPGNPNAPGYQVPTPTATATSTATATATATATTTATPTLTPTATVTPTMAIQPTIGPVAQGQPYTFTTTITVPVAGPVTAAQAAAGQTVATAPMPVTVTVTPGATFTVTQGPTGTATMTMTPVASVTVTPTVTAGSGALPGAAQSSYWATAAQWAETVKHEIAPKLKLAELGLNGAFVFFDQGQATLQTADKTVVQTSVAMRTGQFAMNGARKVVATFVAVANLDPFAALGNGLDSTRIWRSGRTQMDRLLPPGADDAARAWFNSVPGATNIWTSGDAWKIPLFDNRVARGFAGWINNGNLKQFYHWAEASGGKIISLADWTKVGAKAAKVNIIFEGGLALGSIGQNYWDLWQGTPNTADPSKLKQDSLYTATRSSVANLYDFALDVGPAQFWFAQLTNDGAHYLGTGMDYGRSNSTRHVVDGWFATGEAMYELWNMEAAGNTNGTLYDANLKLVNGVSNDGQSIVMLGQAVTKHPAAVALNAGWAYADGSAMAQYNAYALDANGNHLAPGVWKQITAVGYLVDQLSTWGVGSSASAKGIELETKDKIAALRSGWADYQANGAKWLRYYGGGVSILGYEFRDLQLSWAAQPAGSATPLVTPSYDGIWAGMTAAEQAQGVVPNRFFNDRIVELKMQGDIKTYYLEDLNEWRNLPLAPGAEFNNLSSSYAFKRGDQVIAELQKAYPNPTATGLVDGMLLDTKIHYAQLYAIAIANEGGDYGQAFSDRRAQFGVTDAMYDHYVRAMTPPQANVPMVQ